MHHAPLVAALSACVLGLTVPVFAQESAATAVESASYIKMRFATFDPANGEPVVAESLQSRDSDRLWIVQSVGLPTEAFRAAVRRVGGQVHGYLADHAYVVRMDAAAAERARASELVRWVGRYHAAYRIDPALIDELEQEGELPTRRYNMVVVDKHNDKPLLAAGITAMGGVIDNEQEGSLLFTVTLDGSQLLQAARLDQVLWIDRWTAPETDVDNARIQGGANYVEGFGGYTGQGLNVHIYEGIDAGHQAYSGTVTNVLSSGASTGHGTNTAGIVFGDGTGNPQFRGLAPDTGKFYTNYSSVSGSRYGVVSELVNNRNVSHTTASWGGGRTLNYTSVSADTDDIIFDHDIAWTQSQSNASNQQSRPQAWAKNIFSIGGVDHFNNSNPVTTRGQPAAAARGRLLTVASSRPWRRTTTRSARRAPAAATRQFRRHLGCHADRRGAQHPRDRHVHDRGRPGRRREPVRHAAAQPRWQQAQQPAALHDPEGTAGRQLGAVLVQRRQHGQPS